MNRAAAIFVVVMSAVWVSAASGGAGEERRVRILRFESRATVINDFVDIGAPGPSPGDIYVFHDELFSLSRPERKVGDAEGRCNLINPVKGRFECTIVTTLAKGSITFNGILINAAGAISVGSVTGGTGAYLGVKGEGVIDLGPPQGPHRVTIRLVLD